ncbi:radical SAM/SPASM domain-containing protein [Aeromonas sp. A5]|uniref:radical SAM protein n=1 Tax=unclassified Aeromonas TaxID=257493 RepID=UPI00376F5D0B
MTLTQTQILQPLRFNSLVLEITTRCNASCAICYQGASPHGSNEWGVKEIDIKVLKKVIRDAIKIPNLCNRLHISGGEAFLKTRKVLDIIKLGRDVGYKEITLTTNASWGKTPQKASSICKKLEVLGVTDIEISWDYWHMRYINRDNVVNVLYAAKQQSINTTLRILTSKSHSVSEALHLLGDGCMWANTIMWGKVFRSGRAAECIEQNEFYSESVERGKGCHNCLNLTVNAKGDVFPCCAGFDQTDYANLGNIEHENIIDIASRMSGNLWLRQLVFDGVISMEEVLIDKGYTNINLVNNGMCSRCWSIFKEKEATDIIKEYGRVRAGKIMLKIINEVRDSYNEKHSR